MSGRRWFVLFFLALSLSGCRGKLDLAAIQAQREKWESAARLYREYIADNPNSGLAFRSLSAIECNRLHEYEQCAEHADRLLTLMPIDSQGVATGVYAHTLLAKKAAAAKDTASVRRHMERVAQIYYNAAFWNYMNENYDIAETYFKNVIRLKPDDPAAYNRLGILFWNRNMSDSSIAWFKRAVKVDPFCEDALVNLMVMYRQTGQMAKAFDAYDRLAAVRKRLYPDSVFTDRIDTTRKPLLDYRGAPPPQHYISF